MGILLPLGLAFQGGADRRHGGLVGGVEDIGERPPRGSVAIAHQLQDLQGCDQGGGGELFERLILGDAHRFDIEAFGFHDPE